jgi:hypothetical protein
VETIELKTTIEKFKRTFTTIGGENEDEKKLLMHKTFEKLSEDKDALKYFKLEDLSSCTTVALTLDNNLIFYESKARKIVCFSLNTNQVFLEKKITDWTNSIITRLIISKNSR